MGTEFMIYLDTHVILWLFVRKGEGLSIRALNLIESDTEIAISPMVFTRIGIPTRDWTHHAGRKAGIRLSP